MVLKTSVVQCPLTMLVLESRQHSGMCFGCCTCGAKYSLNREHSASERFSDISHHAKPCCQSKKSKDCNDGCATVFGILDSSVRHELCSPLILPIVSSHARFSVAGFGKFLPLLFGLLRPRSCLFRLGGTGSFVKKPTVQNMFSE